MNEMNTNPSQNILQLRELAEKLCMQSIQHEYKDIILLMKKLADNSQDSIAKCRSNSERVKCYETMWTEMNNLLQKIKISE